MSETIQEIEAKIAALQAEEAALKDVEVVEPASVAEPEIIKPRVVPPAPYREQRADLPTSQFQFGRK